MSRHARTMNPDTIQRIVRTNPIDKELYSDDINSLNTLDIKTQTFNESNFPETDGELARIIDGSHTLVNMPWSTFGERFHMIPHIVKLKNALNCCTDERTRLTLVTPSRRRDRSAQIIAALDPQPILQIIEPFITHAYVDHNCHFWQPDHERTYTSLSPFSTSFPDPVLYVTLRPSRDRPPTVETLPYVAQSGLSYGKQEEITQPFFIMTVRAHARTRSNPGTAH